MENKVCQDGLDDDVTNPDKNVTVNVGSDNNPDPGFSTSSFDIQTREVPLTEGEHWFKAYWRPAAAAVYLVTCLFDFVIAPILTMILPKLIGIPYAPWDPLTLHGSGLYHLSFGAIIGVYAWGRTREKVCGRN